MPLHYLNPSFSFVLASTSPRRRELLAQTGIQFLVQKIDIDESYIPDCSPEEIVMDLSCRKARYASSILKENDNQIIITADTIVWHQNKVLNKPIDREEAIQMLQSLSGKSHSVFTGVCLKSPQKEHCFFAETKVSFYELETETINYYVDKYKPYDKAGAYGIQEWIGLIGAKSIEGCFFNVVGLPVPKLILELNCFLEKRK